MLLQQVSWFDTPLGPMLAIANEEGLFHLEFVDRFGAVIPGDCEPFHLLQKELAAYFKGQLIVFKTPVHLLGTPFQKHVWQELLRIPYGETRSYTEQALAIGKPSACRAVANANGANKLALVVPCHRIINSSGELGGYRWGIARKKWLLQHESKFL